MDEKQPRWKQVLRESRALRRWNLTSLGLSLPLLFVGYYYYGSSALRLAVISALTAVACEAVAGRLVLRRRTVDDWNAVVIGLWIALMLPAGCSPWLGVTGAAFAVLVVKIPFGGTQSAPFIPAAAGFAFLTVCFPERVFAYAPSAFVDPIDSRPLAALLRGGQFTPRNWNISSILLGQTVGPMGTGGILMIAVVLLVMLLLHGRRSAALASFGFLAICALTAYLFPRVENNRIASVWMELCSGSLAFAAVYLLPDPASLPARWFTRLGYGAMAGLLAMLLRYLGSYDENICFALLLANASLPLLERARAELRHIRAERAEKKGGGVNAKA
ncbi:MAG: RnfABCDGE type electron transport complex subunit D [Oscillospiraceae bacterium]|jgi:electron transport complex protein RnfD|nr:RnfABCDGE type electron transport complex subunit D [Oscillospiraceae bacterium]